MSNLQTYLQHIEGVTGYRRSLARIGKLTGGYETELLGSKALADHVRGADPGRVEWGYHSAAGAVAGGIIGAKHGHPLLGAISGWSTFTNAPALLDKNTRNEAFWNLAQTHGGVLGSLAMPDNRGLGFALGYIALGFARYYYGDWSR